MCLGRNISFTRKKVHVYVNARQSRPIEGYAFTMGYTEDKTVLSWRLQKTDHLWRIIIG